MQVVHIPVSLHIISAILWFPFLNFFKKIESRHGGVMRSAKEKQLVHKKENINGINMDWYFSII